MKKLVKAQVVDELQKEIFGHLRLHENCLLSDGEMWDMVICVPILMKQRKVKLCRKISDEQMHKYLYCIISQHLGSIFDYPTICKVYAGIKRLFASLNSPKGFL